jgi:hypothetical protein
VRYSTGAPGFEAEAFAIVKRMKMDHDDYTLEGLADFRSVIWKILLENSQNIVQALRRLNVKHANRATKVRYLSPYTAPSLVMDVCPSLQANCAYIMNHRIDTNDPEFQFLPKFAQVVQDLWTEEIIPLLLDRPSVLYLPDNAE